jgi:tripartite-type tricarboxylate transporter receptor subunit TctC
MVHVPYKGEGPNLLDLVAGRVHVSFISVTSALAFVKDGRLRVVTVALDQRAPLAPDVPTLAEAGMPNVAVRHFGGLYGPAKMPREIVERLSRETNSLLNLPDVREQLQRQGYAVKGSSPEGLAAITKENLAQWKAAIRESGMVLE